MYLFAFGTCYYFIYHHLKKEKAPFLDKIPNLFFWAIIGLLIGARLFSEVIYSQNIGILLQPWKMFWPFDSNMNFVGIQGMSYHGGLVGGAVAIVTYCLVTRIPIGNIGDKIAIGTSLGYGFGRLGNFINGELFGRITTSPFGMIFPLAEHLPYADSRVKSVADTLNISPNTLGLVNLPRHPSQLYELFAESTLTFIILYIIYKIIRKTSYYATGMFMSLYVIFYSIGRFIVEYFRQPDSGLDFVIKFSDISNPRWLYVSPLNFTTGQVLSAVMITLSIITLILTYIINGKIKKHVLI